MDEINEFSELLDGSRFHRLDRDSVLIRLAREFGHEPIRRLVAEEDNPASAQTLNGSVEGSGRGPEVNHHVHLPVTGVFGPVDQNALVQLLAPLDHIHPGKEKEKFPLKIIPSNLCPVKLSTYFPHSWAKQKPSSRRQATTIWTRWFFSLKK